MQANAGQQTLVSDAGVKDLSKHHLQKSAAYKLNKRQTHSTIRNRFVLYMGSMFLILGILGGVSYLSLQSTISDFKEVTQEKLLQFRKIVYLQDLVSLTNETIYQYVALGDFEEAELIFNENIIETEESFNDVLANLPLTGKQTQLLIKAKNEWVNGASIGHRILAMTNPKNDPMMPVLLRKFENHTAGAIDIMYEVHNINTKQIEQRRLDAQQSFSQTRIITLAGFFTGILTFIAGAIAMQKFVLKPAHRLLTSLEKFGQGDLTHRIQVRTNDEFGALAMGFNHMADNLEKDQQKLAELAIRDGLTGLYNRREFERLLSDEVHRFRRHGHPVSLLILDIDHFKQINDRYGHQAGDAALKTVANIITNQSRTGDVIARYGGEEITILLPETDVESAHILAERTCRAIEEFPIMISPGQALPITVSIGIATIPVNAQSARDLISSADLAMYEAKRSGRNCVRQASPLAH